MCHNRGMPRSSLDSAVRALLARFRRQRPLRSGSLLMTLLGDSVSPRGGAITLGSLIALARPLGLTERLVRTSVGRLAQQGWLSARREGRLSEYDLTARGRRTFAEATRRIYGAEPKRWSQTWTMVLLPPGARTNERVREELSWLGFGQLAPGLLAHPGRDTDDARQQLRELGLKDDVVVLQAASAGDADDRRLIAAGWDLAELARGYRRFLAAFMPIHVALESGASLQPELAFVIRTLLIHEYRKLHLRDPQLPGSLLPEDWVGAAAYDLCGKLYRRVFDAAERHLSACATSLQGSLPPASREARERFSQ